MSRAKDIGSGFEYRVLDFIQKFGLVGTKKQPGSGLSRNYCEDKGDLTGTLQVHDKCVDFLFECKKTTKGTFCFIISWIADTKQKAEKMIPTRIPIVIFSGQYKPIYCAVDKKTFFALFGNYDSVIRRYECSGSKTITINWNKLDPLLTGHVHEHSSFLKDCKKLIGAELPADTYVFYLADFLEHLTYVLKESSKTQ